MIARRRVLVESCLLAALTLVGAVLESRRRGLEWTYLAFALVGLGPFVRRALAFLGKASAPPRSALAFEVAAFGGLAVYPFGDFGFALGALASLVATSSPEPTFERLPAWLERGPCLALGVATGAVFFASGAGAVAWGLLALALAETFARGEDDGARIARRVATFMLLLAPALVPADPWRWLPVRYEDLCRLAAAVIVVSALTAEVSAPSPAP